MRARKRLKTKPVGDFLKEGNALLKRGDYGAALDAFESAVELEPGNAKAYNNRGVALARLERYDDEPEGE